MASKVTIPAKDINNFGERLRALLKDNHLTQQQLADSIGVSLNAVNDWINEKSQPKRFIQLFGMLKFFYERVSGFSPLQLFCSNDNCPEDPLQVDIGKGLEQSVRAKLEQEYKDKLERTLQEETTKIEERYYREIQKVKEKYESHQIDELIEENKRLKRGLQPVKCGRQDYTQYKERLDKSYKKLKQEFEEYKEAYNALSLANLTDEELENLSKTLAYGNVLGFAQMRLKKACCDKEFLNLLSEVFNKALYAYERGVPNFEELGKKLYDIIDRTISDDLIRKTRAYRGGRRFI